MKAIICYQELVDYIENHYKVRPSISYVDSKTINVSYQVTRFIPAVSLNVKIENVTSETLLFTYDCSAATKLLIRGVVSFLKEQLEEKFLTVDDRHNCILIHIANIEPMQKAFEHVTLSDIVFVTNAVEIAATLK
ncbi:hypothetical protein [uncultured Bacteroides sp.]|uniref:hypothetical protein n=1 Tax=uncultured Bacteroides sp. TaxID=162156 RepID=UPI0025F5F9C3|nr:hypothetical protein [uncultured Bacteroides sp.]